MSKRLICIVLGSVCLVALELVLEGIQYTNPPDWFYPIWMALFILQIIALPAHILTSFIVSLLPSGLQPPLLPKPTLRELGSLYTAILLVCNAVEGALLGWFLYLAKQRVRKK